MTGQSHAADQAPQSYFGYANPSERPADTLIDASQALRAIGTLLANFDDHSDLDTNTREGVDIILQSIARQIDAIAPGCRCAADDFSAPYPRFSTALTADADGHWHTLAEYAAMELPGLPTSDTDPRWLAIVKDWNNARRFRDETTGVREYNITYLPDDAQAEFYRRLQSEIVA